jgi:hypothetical protein
MSNREKLEIDKVFEIATRFVEEPAIFEKYPDGSEFYIGFPHFASELGPGPFDDDLIQVKVKTGYSNLEGDL